jgi:hypothetical protein
MNQEQTPFAQYQEVVDDLISDLRVVADQVLGKEKEMLKAVYIDEDVREIPGLHSTYQVDLKREDDAIGVDWRTFKRMNEQPPDASEGNITIPSETTHVMRAVLVGVNERTFTDGDEPESVRRLHGIFLNLLVILEGRGEEAQELAKTMMRREQMRSEKIEKIFYGL